MLGRHLKNWIPGMSRSLHFIRIAMVLRRIFEYSCAKIDRRDRRSICAWLWRARPASSCETARSARAIESGEMQRLVRSLRERRPHRRASCVALAQKRSPRARPRCTTHHAANTWRCAAKRGNQRSARQHRRIRVRVDNHNVAPIAAIPWHADRCANAERLLLRGAARLFAARATPQTRREAACNRLAITSASGARLSLRRHPVRRHGASRPGQQRAGFLINDCARSESFRGQALRNCHCGLSKHAAPSPCDNAAQRADVVERICARRARMSKTGDSQRQAGDARPQFDEAICHACSSRRTRRSGFAGHHRDRGSKRGWHRSRQSRLTERQAEQLRKQRPTSAASRVGT